MLAASVLKNFTGLKSNASVSSGSKQSLRRSLRRNGNVLVRASVAVGTLYKDLKLWVFDATRASHLNALLEDNKTLSTKDIHDSGVRTLCVCQPGRISLDKVRIWLEELLWDKNGNMDIYRCKGVLSVVNSDHQLHTLQMGCRLLLHGKGWLMRSRSSIHAQKVPWFCHLTC